MGSIKDMLLHVELGQLGDPPHYEFLRGNGQMVASQLTGVGEGGIAV